MTKPISRPAHGFTDYSYVPTVAVAPEVFGFADEKTAATLCRVLSGNILLSSLLTRAEWGVLRVLPFKAHLALDTGVGLFTVAAPWIFGFYKNERARNTFVAMVFSASWQARSAIRKRCRRTPSH